MNTDDKDISRLYHEAGKPVPSSELDDAILASSRDAVEKQAAARGPFAAGWPAAASIAAVIIIALILVPVLQREQHSLVESDDNKGAKAVGPAEINKKHMESAAPASEPEMLLKESRSVDDEGLPAAALRQTGTATTPSAGEILPFKEEYDNAEADELDMQRSRMQAADSAPFAIHTPEMWEVEISRLIVAGRTKEAAIEFDKMKQMYPHYQINQSLLEQLGQHNE